LDLREEGLFLLEGEEVVVLSYQEEGEAVEVHLQEVEEVEEVEAFHEEGVAEVEGEVHL